MIIDKLYTWIDIQDCISDYFANSDSPKVSGVSFRAYWDGLNIYITENTKKEEITKILETIFLARFNEQEYVILLENNQKLSVSYEIVDQEDIDHLALKPSFSRFNYIVPQKKIVHKNSKLQTKIFAYHSFKGGVGRTLHAVSHALQLAEKHKVLLIDADFEAPGITWMVENTSISFADYLAMLHGTPEEIYDNIITSTATILKQQTEENEKLFILPAFRGVGKRNPSLEIKPEYILKFNSDPYVLTEIIDKLGAKLGVDAIIIDLRAGISELSSGWLLDPRIQKYFVTTLSSQSLSGTTMMFEILSQHFKQYTDGENKNAPNVIFSQVPKESKKELENSWSENFADSTVSEIRKGYCSAFITLPPEIESYEAFTKEEIISREISSKALFTEEIESLKNLPKSWEKVSAAIRNTNIYRTGFQTIDLEIHAKKQSPTSLQEKREKLRAVASDLVYAENSDSQDFLITEPIKKLAEKYRYELPSAVIIGAKGAGKTFLYKQLVLAKNWKDFGKKTINSGFNNEAYIYPVTIPDQLAQNKNFNTLQKTIAPNGLNIWLNCIKPDIEKKLETSLTVSEWREQWLDYIAWAAAFKIGDSNIGKQFLEYLQNKKQKLVCVFDGLEEIFKDFDNNEQHKRALAALLTDVPNWIESQTDRHLGVVIFIRQDIIITAIPQNSGQFIGRHKDYELKWNAIEALRLFNWIISKYAIIDNCISISDLYQASEDELKRSLVNLWGLRMGGDESNEANTTNWILGSLANLKKEIQSRDIVRFLEFASDTSKNTKTLPYTDRILFPQAIRSSIEKVGKEKIKDVKSENKPLESVLNKLSENPKEIKFPCPKKELTSAINESEVSVLEGNGVVITYNDEYYMAELFRKGLGFEYSKKGKPKVLYF